MKGNVNPALKNAATLCTWKCGCVHERTEQAVGDRQASTAFKDMEHHIST